MEREDLEAGSLELIIASSEQGADRYPGVDGWRHTSVPAGTRLAQLDFVPDRVDNPTRTASQFFTTEAEALKHLDPETGKIDARALSERLQVSAFRFGRGDDFQHSSLVTIYETTQDLDVATADVRDNLAYGAGGAVQYYTSKNTRALIAGTDPQTGEAVGYMTPVEQYVTENRDPAQPVYGEIDARMDQQFGDKIPTPEDRTVENKIVVNTVGEHHESFKQRLITSGMTDVEQYAGGMAEREAFSNQAREVLESAELTGDWQTAADLRIPETAPYPGDARMAVAMIEDPLSRRRATNLLERMEQKAAANRKADAQQAPPVTQNEPEQGPERDDGPELGD